MGGLYITPNSTEMGWKRRGLRVSSEALLCLGVATIVASFVIDVNADGSKPNIWILIGGVIMLMAAAIGWSLTFCLIWETIQSDNIGSTQNPKAPIHSIQVVVPETDVNSKLDPIYLAASGGHLKPDTSKHTGKQKTKESKDKRKKRSGNSDESRGGSSGTRKSKDSEAESKRSGGKRTEKPKNSNSSKTGSSHTKTGRSSDYSRRTGTTGTTSSSYTGTTSSSQDSGSYTSSEQRKSYV
jgi:hypothetical protein